MVRVTFLALAFLVAACGKSNIQTQSVPPAPPQAPLLASEVALDEAGMRLVVNEGRVDIDKAHFRAKPRSSKVIYASMVSAITEMSEVLAGPTGSGKTSQASDLELKKEYLEKYKASIDESGLLPK